LRRVIAVLPRNGVAKKALPAVALKLYPSDSCVTILTSPQLMRVKLALQPFSAAKGEKPRRCGRKLSATLKKCSGSVVSTTLKLSSVPVIADMPLHSSLARYEVFLSNFQCFDVETGHMLLEQLKGTIQQ
jgi:hypothetical protein